MGLALLCLGFGSILMAASADKGGAAIRGGVEPVNAGAADLRNIGANNSPSVARNPARPAEVVVVNRVDTPSFSCAMSVSADGGSSFTPSAIPFPGGEEEPPRCFAPDVAFGPDGRLAVSFVTLAGQGNTPHAAWVTTSGDGGRTLSNPVRVVGPRAFQVRVAADPGSAGRLYLSWAQASDTGTFAFAGDASPVMVARSPDGTRFAKPVRVNDTPAGDGRWQYLPEVAVTPTGRVDVVYYDRRAGPENVFNQVSLQSSADGGSTFGPRVVVSDKAFDSRIGFGSERGMPDLGSRLGLVSSEGRALAVWTDTRAGTQASNKQDLGRAVVEFRARQAWRAPLLGLGMSGVLGGLILMVVAALRRPRSPDPVSEGSGPSGA